MPKEEMKYIQQERYTEVIEMSDMVDIKENSIRKISCQLDMTSGLNRRLLDKP
jgi:rRNA processing protein Krr1/Pno1